MKVWITKYALTSGIEEIDSDKVSRLSIDDCGYLTFVRSKVGYCMEGYTKNDYKLDKDSAVAKAEEMRQKKIESLKKQIEKLERMRFDV